MTHNKELVFSQYLQKNIKRSYQKKVFDLYQEMYIELNKKDKFTDKLSIVTDTIENIFNIINNKKLLSYSEYAIK